MSVRSLKLPILAIAASAMAALLVSCNGGQQQQQAAKPKFDASNEQHQTSYVMGREMGRGLKDMEDAIDMQIVLMAMHEAIDGKPAQLSDSAIATIDARVKREIRDRQRQKRRQVEEDNMETAKAFLENNKGAAGVTVTESGLQYAVITEGTGAKPTLNDMVKVQYRSTLADGTVFRESGGPATMAVTGETRGWAEALQLMKTGGKYKFFVPPELAYGRRGTPRSPVGPNMTIIYEIELLEIEKPEKPEKVKK